MRRGLTYSSAAVARGGPGLGLDRLRSLLLQPGKAAAQPQARRDEVGRGPGNRARFHQVEAIGLGFAQSGLALYEAGHEGSREIVAGFPQPIARQRVGSVIEVGRAVILVVVAARVQAQPLAADNALLVSQGAAHTGDGIGLRIGLGAKHVVVAHGAGFQHYAGGPGLVGGIGGKEPARGPGYGVDRLECLCARRGGDRESGGEGGDAAL